MTQQQQAWPPKGLSYAAIVSQQDEGTPQVLVASVYEPDDKRFQFYRLDRKSHRWVEDARLLTYFVGDGDDWVPRALTPDQAADIAKGWGGTLQETYS